MRIVNAEDVKRTASECLLDPSHIESVCVAVDKTKTVDAVQVVFCKDCVLRRTLIASLGVSTCDWWGCEIQPDGFCNHGMTVEEFEQKMKK